MNIEPMAGGMSETGMKVMKMALDQTEVQGEAIQKLFASAEIIQDPDLGQKIDLLA